MKNKQKTEVQEEVQEQIEHLEQLQRLQAEFINYRTRVEKEKIQASLIAREAVILKFLDVKDNFDRAPKLDKGMEMVYNQFQEIFKEEKVREIENKEFNPAMHEAIATDPTTKQGEIKEVIQKGYLHNDKVIRPSKVIVGSMEKKNE
tara:strand:+ start:8717 stop:9157 length:441 start_codon:yes stop_codon:yes gene_type:complete